MPGEMTLEELKKLNAETPEDQGEQTVIDNLTPDEENAEEQEPEAEEQAEEEEDENEKEPAENGEDAGSAEEEVPDWAKPESEAKYTDTDAANIRRKWKSKLKESDEENKRLEARIAELESGESKTPELKRPNPDDFEEHADYQEALVDYKFQVRQAKQDSETAARKREEERNTQQKRIEKSVNDHYTRAAQLAEKSGIKPETYQAADLRVRQTIDAVYPDGGDAITDALIANLGEGSEKVMYHLGVNPSKLQALREKFEQDNTGLSVAAYLGSLKAELDLPAKRKTAAPTPTPEVKGDGSTQSETALKKKYQEAHKKGNTQAAFDLKRQAKAKGINTGAW